MDRISDFAKYYGCEPATEAIVEAALAAVLAAEIIAIGVCFKHSAKKNAEQKAANQKAYFDLHQIPESDRANYANKVRESAYQDLVKLANGALHSSKSKKALDDIRGKIAKEVADYVNDEGEKNDFEPNRLEIKFGLISHEKGEYELVEVDYRGKGFIPADNVWEIGCYAIKPVADRIYNALHEKYAEEIRCKFIEISHDTEYGTISIG